MSRAVIDLQVLHEAYMKHQETCKKYNWNTPFESWRTEPRPEWHGKEVNVIGDGIFQFDGEELPKYHIIHPKHLIPVE